MDKRSESEHRFAVALAEAEQRGTLTSTPKGKKVLVTNLITHESRTFALAPGGARGLQNALSQLKRLERTEEPVPKVGETARVGTLDRVVAVRNADKLTVAQRAYMVWHHANEYAKHEECKTVRANIDGRGKLVYPSRSRNAADYYGVELEHGLSSIHDALFPTMKAYKSGKEACLDFLRLSGNAYYLNASGPTGRRWLIRVDWKDAAGIVVPPKEYEPDAIDQRAEKLTPEEAGETREPEVAYSEYRCRVEGCTEGEFPTEAMRDEHEVEHEQPEPIKVYRTVTQEEAATAIVEENRVVTTPPSLTGNDEVDAALLLLADALKEHLVSRSMPAAEVDLAARTRALSDRIAELEARNADLEEFMLTVQQFIEDGQPMSAIAYVTDYFDSDGTSAAAV